MKGDGKLIPMIKTHNQSCSETISCGAPSLKKGYARGLPANSSFMCSNRYTPDLLNPQRQSASLRIAESTKCLCKWHDELLLMMQVSLRLFASH